MRGVGYTPANHVAIREGRKTQTRRPLRMGACPPNAVFAGIEGGFARFYHRVADCDPIDIRLPHGPVGTRCYVREPWRTLGHYDSLKPRDMPSVLGGGRRTQAYGLPVPIEYTCDGVQRGFPDGPRVRMAGRVRQAMFLPEWAARTFYTVAGVRVHLLWDITEEDAKAEAVEPEREGAWGRSGCHESYRNGFFEVWQRLYGDDPIKGYYANPWVAAMTIGDVVAL